MTPITIKKYSLALIILITVLKTSGQTQTPGPVINTFGKVFKVENQDFKIDATQNFYVVMDISKSSEDNESMNKRIETAARFLNMHAQNGVPKDKMKVALVVHGSAYKDVMNKEAYNKKFGVDNPNEKLNVALLQEDVQIIICGQSAAYRGLVKEDLIPGVQLSLSAMTALVQLQNQNYRLINF